MFRPRNLTPQFLLLLDLILIVSVYTTPLLKIAGDSLSWPEKAIILYGGFMLIGCLSVIVGGATIIQSIKNKQFKSTIMGVILAIVGIVVTTGFLLYLLLLNECYYYHQCI